MSKLPHDTIIPFKESNKSKKEQVAEMFDQIAGRYDFMNRFLSARTDVVWRKIALNMLKKYQPKKILDIATGTGDMAIRAYHTLQPEQITGIDISKQMLEVGKQKIAKEGLAGKIDLQLGDCENLIFHENSFDVVMAAFGVRNFENLENGLSEMKRVMKPGGQLLIIEFSKPNASFVKWGYRIYMQIVAPKIAAIFKQNVEAYQYLNKSAHAFPERSEFATILQSVGFKNASFKPLTFGICCIYRAEK